MKRWLCAFFFITALLTMAEGAVLWRDPGPIESLDLAGGPGGAGKAPRAPFTFVSEEKGGTSPKVTVRDARGAEWIVKFGEEVKSENFASRIAWAAGYFAEPTYFVREGKIEGANDLGRAASAIRGGAFQNARFELKTEAMKNPVGKWNIGDSKLKGSRELAGYKTLFILLSNWDVKPENLSIVKANGEQIYAVTDWGATMGRPAELSGASKWDCERYSSDTKNLIEGVENGFVVFNFQGKQGTEILKNIRVEDVQWLMQRLGKLSDAQIDAALQASGATPEEKACFASAFKSRLGQLMTVAQQSGTPGDAAVTRTRKETTTTIRKQEQD